MAELKTSFLQKLAISPRKKISLNVRELVLDAVDNLTSICEASRTDVIESILINHLEDYIDSLEKGLLKEKKSKFKTMLVKLRDFKKTWGE